jgi:hypothetical protein
MWAPRPRPRPASGPPPTPTPPPHSAAPSAWLPPALRRNWPLLKRIAVTVAMIAVIRAGYYIPLPGVDVARLPSAAVGATEGARARAHTQGGLISALAASLTAACDEAHSLTAPQPPSPPLPLPLSPPLPKTGERIMRAIYGQASELPASLFDLGISPYINASILVTILLLLPKDLIEWQPLDRLREARKEGKSVRRAGVRRGRGMGEGSSRGRAGAEAPQRPLPSC